MKKEEEIEKLSQSILKTIDSVTSLTVTKEEENIFHQGFYSGYRQCEKQHYTEEDLREAIEKARDIFDGKDIADKKYTLDDMKKACACGIDIACKKGENDFQPFEDLINSLNKQD